MKTSIQKMVLSTAIASLMAAIPLSASATNGNQATATGQNARGVGGAGIAYPQDTLALGINPASGVHIGNRLDAGLEIFSPDRGMTLAGTTYDANETDIFVIPEFGYNRMLGEDKSFGISISAAGGQNTDYGFHPLLGGPAEVDLAQVFIKPAYSVKVGKHAFGASINFIYQTFEANGLAALSGSSFDPANFTDNGKDSAFGAGIGIGWMGEITDRLTLGATYESEINVDDFDDYRGLIPGGSIDIPEKYGVGIAFSASDKVDLLFDVTQVNFSDTEALGNSTAGDGRSPLGFSTGPGFGWDDITIVRAGVVYKHSPSLTLRAGINHGDNPVPNNTFNDTFFNSLTPGIPKDHLSLGFTRMINEKLSITGSYVHTFEETLEGNGAKLTAPGAGTPAPDLRMEQDAIGVSFGWML